MTLSTPKLRLAVLASHEGTTMQAIIDAIASGRLHMDLILVISNNSKSGALRRAETHGIDSRHISNLTHNDTDGAIAEALRGYDVDHVFLAGYMRKVGPKTLEYCDAYNTHPSLLPKFAGYYGSAIYPAILEAGESVTGVTVHLVDGEYDTGDIVKQSVVPIEAAETADSLENKVRIAEKALVVETLEDLASSFLLNISKRSNDVQCLQNYTRNMRSTETK